jgi:ribonuclease D
MTIRDPTPPPAHLVTEIPDLLRLCDVWRSAPYLCLDTEFVRTRTFYARLGLIQVNDGREVSLVDTVALSDLTPFGELLGALDVDVVLHSCSEDLGIFVHELGVLPSRVFDTQIVSALVGLGFSRSYQGLIEEVLEIHLSKGETRSNWTARPLSESQVRYAAADVEYLPDLYEFLVDRLHAEGREEWAREELAPLSDVTRHHVEPSEAWRRVKGGSGLDPRGRALLRELCAWRDREAIDRDLARNFVMREASLVDLARRHPTRERDLYTIRDLKPGERRRYGAEILEMIERVRKLHESELPPRPARRPRVPRQKEVIRALQKEAAKIAEALGVAPEILTKKKVLEALVRRVLSEGRDDLPDELEGWRAEVVGRPLLELLLEHRSGAHRSGVKLA